jgi:S1-C subfamily serine protease
MAALGGDRIGRTVAVRILRAGEPRELPVTIGERR